MTDGLLDPDKPAGFVVSVDEETGVATRNDGKLLQPAAKNPWYRLATMHGEQTGKVFDQKLHEINRNGWNSAILDLCDDEERVALQGPHNTVSHDFKSAQSRQLNRARYSVEEELASYLKNAGKKSVLLPDTYFQNSLSLNGFIFPWTLVISGSSFKRKFSVRKAYLNGRSFFVDVYFGSDTDFTQSVFQERLDCRNAYFEGISRFSDMRCKNWSYFQNANFESNSYFIGAVFSQKLGFQKSKFSKFADFNKCKFLGQTSFNHTVFGSVARFEGITSGGPFEFRGVVCEYASRFKRAKFQSSASFWETQFRSRADFEKSEFFGRPNFQDGVFAGPTSFFGANFSGSAPQFQGRNMHQDSNFSLDKRLWPNPTLEKAKSELEAYTRLRQIMSEMQKPEDEHFFFRQEMRYKAILGDFWQRLPHKLFQGASEFGYSIKRPIVGLGLVIAFGWALLGSQMSDGSGPEAVAGIWRGFALSFSNTFSFFGFQRLYFDPEDLRKLPRFAQILGAGQTVAGFVLLFFLGLGLRNRFRLK